MSALAVLVGPAVEPYRDGISEAVQTPWDIVPVADIDAAAEPLARAAALVTISYGRDWPPAPKLRLMQIAGAGYNGIELAALPSGITLCNVFEHESAVAEYVLLAILEWSHQLSAADRDMRAGNWGRAARFAAEPREEVAGKTLLVIGLGRIGQAVARRAAALEIRVIAANRTVRRDVPWVEHVIPLDQLRDVLGEADFVVLACALAPETQGLIDAAALARMKPGAVIINPARGPLIEEAAVYDALASRRIGGAVLDTWWDYPLTAGPRHPSVRFPFHGLDNVLMSAHIAGWTRGTLNRRTIAIARNLDRLARGEPLLNVVMET